MHGGQIGSLFSGYRGLDIAAEGFFGAQTIWWSDIDPGAVKINEHHWPDQPNLGDITTVEWSEVAPVDILTGGWPCQPFSVAGKRKGASDERALWPYLARAVRALRPSYVVLENVAAIAAAGELSRATADLVALGYVGSWRCVRAADVGAPHGRARIFILATNTEHDGRNGATLSRGTSTSETQGWMFQPEGCAATNAAGINAEWSVCGGDRGERPQGADRDGSDAAADTNGYRRHEGRSESARQLGGHDALQRGPVATYPDGLGVRQQSVGGRELTSASIAEHDLQWREFDPAIRCWERVLGRAAPPPTEENRRGKWWLSARFVEWMMGLPDGWVTGVPELNRNEQLKALGNGVVPQQAYEALRLMEVA